MNDKNKLKLEHLRWAIESRAANQRCALRLLTLFRNHEAKWKTKKWSRAAHDLLSATFSLWRAAFLADKTGVREEVVDHSIEFLESIIEDNAISYLQDKRSKEWTFNYYTRNARASLENLNRFWPEAIGPYEGKKRNAIQRWEYCQELLNSAVGNFERSLIAESEKAVVRQKRRDNRQAARQKRRKSRAITLAARGTR